MLLTAEADEGMRMFFGAARTLLKERDDMDDMDESDLAESGGEGGQTLPRMEKGEDDCEENPLPNELV